MTIYFTSDWHFNNSRLGEINPLFRPFSNVDEQNRVILHHLNAVVNPKDTLYMLGDVSVDEEGIKLMDKVNCRNRILIVGNYDEGKLDLLFKYFDSINKDIKVSVQGLDSYLNHYPTNYVEDRFNITGHIHGLWKVKPNMVNVGVDAWNFRPVSEKEILFVHNAIQNYYDDNVFVRCLGRPSKYKGINYPNDEELTAWNIL